MCGIFGFVAFGRPALAPEEVVCGREALSLLTHRGPDQSGDWIDGNVFMGHRRLSILDLSEQGRQPMVSDDGGTALAVNGEIYNYADIKRDLGGARFRSESDSEVMLHGYRAWGFDALVDRMDGMYGAVLYDKGARKLFLLRDRPGIKPLFYARTSRYFVWASELKAIQAFLGSELRHDYTALYDFLTYRYMPGPRTAFHDVFKLRPGHYLELCSDSGAERGVQYWRLEPRSSELPERQLAERARELMAASVRQQLMSDVPVGFFLSGGIDSSIVVREASLAHPSPVAFTIGFADRAHDESGPASLVAARLQAEHRLRVLERDDSAGLLARMLDWYDEPHGDSSALPTWHVSALAREHATVVLTGDGGDELFGGYRWYALFDRIRRMQRPLSALHIRAPRIPFHRSSRRPLDRLRNALAVATRWDPMELYGLLLGGMSADEKHPFRQQWEIPPDYDDYWAFRKHYRPELGRRKSLQVIDFHTYLPDDILTKVDRVSMAVSLEARVPFLSRAVIEFAFSLPESFLYRGGELKGGLKYAYLGVLPDEILRRPKKGFSIPMRAWRREVLQPAQTLQEAMLRHYLRDEVLPPLLAA